MSTGQWKGRSHARVDKRRKKDQRKEKNREGGKEEERAHRETKRAADKKTQCGGVRQSQEKKIPGTRRKPRDLEPVGPDRGHAQRKLGQPWLAPSGCQGPSCCQTLGAAFSTTQSQGRERGWGVIP